MYLYFQFSIDYIKPYGCRDGLNALKRQLTRLTSCFGFRGGLGAARLLSPLKGSQAPDFVVLILYIFGAQPACLGKGSRGLPIIGHAGASGFLVPLPHDGSLTV
jgi:hypothetical protein